MTDRRSNSAADLLMRLIVGLLTPMFIQAADGDINFARAAAVETVNAYRARNPLDLISIAQVIAFGLTALGSLGMSMADNISMSMTLRLRASAVASNRAGEACRRALTQPRLDGEPLGHNDAGGLFFDEPADVAPAPDQPANTQPTNTQPTNTNGSDTQASSPPPIDLREGNMQQTDAQTIDTLSANALPPNPRPPKPQAHPAPPRLQSGSVTSSDQHRSLWANAMSDVAAQFTATLPHLPPAERRVASVRAAALSSVARDLLTGTNRQPPPPFALPK